MKRADEKRLAHDERERRTAAALNACKGISTEDLEKYGVVLNCPNVFWDYGSPDNGPEKLEYIADFVAEGTGNRSVTFKIMTAIQLPEAFCSANYYDDEGWVCTVHATKEEAEATLALLETKP
jgi:hypothetical protein